ncbi:MAG: 6-phosphofructokinase [Clostridia bacterium]|nr:6-phosphofructokinase [Clostridia bacterium]
MNFICGNAIVGQSGGPTSAINATLYGVICACYENKEKIKTLYGMKNGLEGLLREDLINLFCFCEDKDNLEALKATPASALGSCRFRAPDLSDDAFYQGVLSILEKYDIRYFFYIGGNDSMDTIDKIAEYARTHSYDIKFIGVPKTIDNDLVLTDHCPGYGSCAKFVATVSKEIVRDCAVYTVPAVTIIEVMGRDTGWIGMATALASQGDSGVDLIYLPETPFCPERFVKSVREALEKHPNVVVVACEGIKYENGEYVSKLTYTDAFGHSYLSGAGRELLALIQVHIGCKSRVVELSTPQRCASHIASKADIDESVKIGKYAVEMVLDGKSGEMVIVKRRGESFELSCAPLSKIANKIKYVPSHFISSDKAHITPEGIEYLKPLIKGEHYPTYKDGLPVHFIID